MPRPIQPPSSTDGIATYALSVRDEWTLLAVTFTIDCTPANTYTAPFLDLRDPAGSCIHRQGLGYGTANIFRYSLAADGEPWVIDTEGDAGFPQDGGYYNAGVLTQRIPLTTLTSQCSLNVYAVEYSSWDASLDTIDQYDPRVVITDLHLWVEDVGASDYQPPAPLPPILVHAPELV